VAETPTLRPLGVGEILDAGIKVYLRHWKPLMICVVGIVLPVEILTVLVLASIDPSTLNDLGGFDTSTTAGSDASGAEAAAFILVALLSGLSTLLATAACFKAVADAWLGATPDAGRSLRFALRNLLRLIWLAIVFGCGLTLAFLALVVPGVWLFVAWSLAVPVLLFERVGAFKSLGRSFRLVRGRWWPVCGALIVGYLLASVISGIVQLIPDAIASGVANDNTVADGIATVIGGTVSAMISTPYTAAIVVLLYFDQRVRKEGFDLQLLAEGLGSVRDPDAPLPAPLVGPAVTPEQRAAAPYWPPPPGWVPPEPEPTNEPRREWWQDQAAASPGTYGGGYEAPRSDDGAPQEPGAGVPPDDPPPEAAAPPGADDAPKRDRNRADWLPPEAPRGPGGL